VGLSLVRAGFCAAVSAVAVSHRFAGKRRLERLASAVKGEGRTAKDPQRRPSELDGMSESSEATADRDVETPADPNPVDASIKALLREVPQALFRLARRPLPEVITFEDTVINLPERRADHVFIVGAATDPRQGALYVEYQLKPDPRRLLEWQYKRAALGLRLEIPVVLLAIYLEKGGRATFPDRAADEVWGIENEFRFTAVRLWEHAGRIRSGELWELAPCWFCVKIALASKPCARNWS